MHRLSTTSRFRSVRPDRTTTETNTTGETSNATTEQKSEIVHESNVVAKDFLANQSKYLNPNQNEKNDKRHVRKVSSGVMVRLKQLDTFRLGERVYVDGYGNGVIKFLGCVHFAQGLYVGVELDESKGQNDGFIRGKRYFSARKGYEIETETMNATGTTAVATTKTTGTVDTTAATTTTTTTTAATTATAITTTTGTTVLGINTTRISDILQHDSRRALTPTPNIGDTSKSQQEQNKDNRARTPLGRGQKFEGKRRDSQKEKEAVQHDPRTRRNYHSETLTQTKTHRVRTRNNTAGTARLPVQRANNVAATNDPKIQMKQFDKRMGELLREKKRLEEENIQLKFDLSSKQNANNLDKATLENDLFEELLDNDKTLKDDRSKNETMEREVSQLLSEKERFEELKYYGTTQNDAVIAILQKEIADLTAQLNKCKDTRRQNLQSWVFGDC
ncbi:hypothetical protein RFI_01383 [Reticulomyxa filosa]|uniref:CAP-Gly domain-containing protein n=1 Tax=Reticulomyxa filosa TaxID=46433 RepID=X6PC48_RETFI|nr:hypothetical protein RFI_01383 [Reticulomyxa filosa]|eukprot:ETO35678.1 hypothetical protein RFI_01383 [Reticulomyxa filosa]